MCGGNLAQPITIRHLGPEDAHILDRVAGGVFDNPVNPAWSYAFLATGVNEIVVALEAGTVVGFASGTALMHPDKATGFFINEVGVGDNHRRQGIATRLVRRIVEIACERGCQEIWLATEGDNTPARGLYRKLDAAETEGIVMYTFQDG